MVKSFLVRASWSVLLSGTDAILRFVSRRRLGYQKGLGPSLDLLSGLHNISGYWLLRSDPERRSASCLLMLFMLRFSALCQCLRSERFGTVHCHPPLQLVSPVWAFDREVFLLRELHSYCLLLLSTFRLSCDVACTTPADASGLGVS